LNKLNNWNGTIPIFLAPTSLNYSKANSSGNGEKSVPMSATNSILKNDEAIENKTINQTILKNSSDNTSSNPEENISKLNSNSQPVTNSSNNSPSLNKPNDTSANTVVLSNISST
jgi:hypothetical protein